MAFFITNNKLSLKPLILGFGLFFFLALSGEGADLVDYSLSDVRVLYVYDDPTTIDWPTLYYLNEQYGCRIDLLTLKNRPRMLRESFDLPKRQIFLNRFHFPEDNQVSFDSILSDLFSERYPDIVLFGPSGKRARYKKLQEYIVNLAPNPRRLFNIQRVYQIDQELIDTTSSLVLNGREFMRRYRDRIDLEVPFFFDWYRSLEYTPEKLTHYRLLRGSDAARTSFMEGINPARLVDIISQLQLSGPMKASFERQATRFVNYFSVARSSIGQPKADFTVNGYRELMFFRNQRQSFTDSLPFDDFQPYIVDLINRAERAALNAVGVEWEGKVRLHDSPHGPKLKFVASVSANGPKEVTLDRIVFHPYWDTALVVLDDNTHLIDPHQSFVREFLVDIERERLESNRPDSLLFSADIIYGQIRMQLFASLPVSPSPDLKIKFDPSFSFVPPVAQVDVDRIVSSMTWKVVVSKPYDFSGKVKVHLETPRGLFAGAYRQEITLDRGNSREMLQIPFSVSQLFEQGIQKQTVTLSTAGKEIASDTGLVRIASCKIEETRTVGFLPDSTGLLEDVLRMTDAAISPLTDRGLQTADLFTYNVIAFGSGCHRMFPSIRIVSDRFEEYLREGGSIVLFGQPDDFPEGILPCSFIPASEYLESDDLSVRLPEARVLSEGYTIKSERFNHYFSPSSRAASAIISPTEKVAITASGASLLSVTRIGDGQIIYCGLPVLEKVAELDLEAIHLFANLLNY